MKKLNILYITEYFPPYTRGGAEISTSLLIKEVSKYHNCFIITGNFQKTQWKLGQSEVFPLLKRNEAMGKKFINIIKNEIKYYQNFFKNKNIINNFINDKKIDVIHIIPTGYYALPLIRSAMVSNKPLMIDCRDGTIVCPIAFYGECNKKFSYGFKCIRCLSKNYSKDFGFLNFTKLLFSSYESFRFKIIKSALIKKVYRKENIILVPLSNYVKKQLIDADYPENKLVVINNICDYEIRNNKYKKENKIIFAGALEVVKGIWIAVRAFELLNIKDLYFDIAGDGREMDSLKKYISRRSIKNINLLGRIDHDKIYELYLKSKIIIAPSIWPEPFGRFVLESMKSGTPLISTKVGGIPEGVKDYETGILVEPDNPKQLAEAIKELLTNKSLYKNITNNLVEAAKKYSPEIIGKQRISLYMKILRK